MDVQRTCGDIASLRLGRFTVVLVAHPDHVRDVLVVHQSRFEKGDVFEGARRLLGQGLLTSEGELHRRQRRLIQPVFHHRRLGASDASMVGPAMRVRDGWRDGRRLDVVEEMVQLTMAVLAKVVFDADIDDAEARETSRALSVALDSFSTLASPFSRLLEDLPSERNREFVRVLQAFDDTVVRLLGERRSSGPGGSDVLSLLMRARDDRTGEAMEDRQIRDEILTFMIAGHETWSNSLAWTWYLLSRHPTARARLEEELREVLDGRPPTTGDVDRLSYTGMVYAETLRIYPPVWTVGRTAVADHELAGYLIPRGSVVLIPPWVVHHDPRWFPEPFEFRPERWRDDRLADVPAFAYFPFGGGRRVCIGMPLAKLAGVLIVATIAQRWRLELVDDRPVEPTPPLMRPAGGLPAIVRQRA